MADDVVAHPLWEGGLGLLSEAELRDDLGLSEGLLADLKTWAEEDSFPGPSFSPRKHRQEGRRLIQRLREEAGPAFDFRQHRTPLSMRLAERYRRLFVYAFDRDSPDSDVR